MFHVWDWFSLYQLCSQVKIIFSLEPEMMKENCEPCYFDLPTVHTIVIFRDWDEVLTTSSSRVLTLAVL